MRRLHIVQGQKFYIITSHKNVEDNVTVIISMACVQKIAS